MITGTTVHPEGNPPLVRWLIMGLRRKNGRRRDGTQTMREMDYDESSWKGLRRSGHSGSGPNNRKALNLKQKECQQNMIISIKSLSLQTRIPFIDNKNI